MYIYSETLFTDYQCENLDFREKYIELRCVFLLRFEKIIQECIMQNVN